MLFWIGLLAAAIFGLLALLVWMTPGEVFRRAWANRRGPDGAVRGDRLRSEVFHFFDFAGDLFLLPFIALTLTGAALYGVHHYVVPLPIVGDIFGAFDFNAAVWEYRIERGALGDVGQRYEEWSRARGFSLPTARFWQEFLWEHWLGLLVAGALFAAAQYWFWAHYYVSTVAAYHRGILKRRRAHRDEDRSRRHAEARTGAPSGWQGARSPRPSNQAPSPLRDAGC